MSVKLLTEHHLEFLSLKGGRRGSSESTHVILAHCWKSHALAHFLLQAGALVHIYNDGSVLVTHGGVEMGQGLHTKMIQVSLYTLWQEIYFFN